ncbi:RNA 2',3'-cyclic phosphodiesterase [Sporosarcina obsidiansis]|uniref:RNA 2',3'-cyclic phosphodiesterase n=1 Tax=Sporosarcina obsidiansis TaxID=2660748 RepID=UPI00129BCBE2|nr:RNA 2',3'-cyclic phosphodiesterase [Sporosarcina obsidiansis]
MTQHYFIGISVGGTTPILELSEHFRTKYQLAERYKVIPHDEDLHITMRYIGKLEEDHMHLLTSSLQNIADDHSCFSTSITGLSFFGSPTGPRVVYLSVEAVGMMRHMQKKISKHTESLLELQKENRFVPHITIAKKRKTAEKMQIVKEAVSPLKLEITGFSLFKIHPNERPSYEEIAFFPLKKS